MKSRGKLIKHCKRPVYGNRKLKSGALNHFSVVLWYTRHLKLCEFVKLSHTETVIELQRFDQIKENS